jgi:hypothetical protein
MWGEDSRRLYDPRTPAEDSADARVMLAVYRVGFWIPLPVVDTKVMENYFQSTANEGCPKPFASRHFQRSLLDQATTSSSASCRTSRTRRLSS